jgi:hypothetical protein
MLGLQRWRRMAVSAALAAAALFGTGCRTGMRQVGNALMNQGTAEINYEESPDRTLFRYFTSENSQARVSGLRVEFDNAGQLKAASMESVEIIRMPSESHQLFAGQIAAGGETDAQAIRLYSDIAGTVVAAAVTAALQSQTGGLSGLGGVSSGLGGVLAGNISPGGISQGGASDAIMAK